MLLKMVLIIVTRTNVCNLKGLIQSLIGIFKLQPFISLGCGKRSSEFLFKVWQKSFATLKI